MFDVAVGERAISHMGHIKMMGAVQPFISGAISKTVNLPHEAGVEDIADAYLQAWRLGIKALAIYRDGSKTAQALRTDAQQGAARAPARPSSSRATRRSRSTSSSRAPSRPRARRRSPRPARSATACRASASRSRTSSRSPATRATSRRACTRTARVGEIFLTDIGKEGSTLRGMMNAFATSISIALQYGVPLDTLVEKFSYMRFEPEGITQNPEIPFAKSMPDYIMRWLASRFLDTDTQEELGILTPEVRARKMAEDSGSSHVVGHEPARPTAATGASTARRAQHPAARHAARHDPRGRRGDDRLPARRPGPHARPGPRPGVRAVRRHDAAHGLLLHVLELRQQHRLRVSVKAGWFGSSRRRTT